MSEWDFVAVKELHIRRHVGLHFLWSTVFFFEGLRCKCNAMRWARAVHGKSIYDQRLTTLLFENGTHASIDIQVATLSRVSRACDDEYTAYKTPMHRALLAPVLTTTKMAKPKAFDSM